MSRSVLRQSGRVAGAISGRIAASVRARIPLSFLDGALHRHQGSCSSFVWATDSF